MTLIIWNKLFTQKQGPKRAFSFVNNFKPLGVQSSPRPTKCLVIKLQTKKNYGKPALYEEIAVHQWQQKVKHVMVMKELNSQ